MIWDILNRFAVWYNQRWQDVGTSIFGAVAITFGMLLAGPIVADFIGVHSQQWRLGILAYILVSVFAVVLLRAPQLNPQLPVRTRKARITAALFTIAFIWLCFYTTTVLMD